MTNHALLIGCATDGLTGVEYDLDLMDTTLRPRGFQIRRICGPQATRAGILAAYRELIDAVKPDEPVVVYYSGHGGRVQAPPPDTDGPSLMDLQFLAPADFHDSSPGDFRGITSVELSVLQRRLTERTENVTVILDCCHAAHMSRDHTLHIKALPKPAPYELLRAHIAKLRAQGELPAGTLDALGNPYAVRIVACAPEQAAFEYEGVDGRPIGVLTESLALALAEAGTQRVSWAAVLTRVRRRVMSLSPFQRPDVEGPSLRKLFETEEDDPCPTLPIVALDADRARVTSAALLGTQLGDVFEVIDPGQDDEPVGTLVIDRLGGYDADGPLTLVPGRDALPLGARARCTLSTAPPLPVLLPDAAEPGAATVLREIDAAPALRPARPGELWLAAVRIGSDGALTLHDRVGPLHDYRADPTAAARARGDLDMLARVQALRALSADFSRTRDAAIDVEWGTVRNGSPDPLPVSGATVYAGDSVYLSVRNTSARTLYLSLVDLGVAGRIRVLTDDSPGGRRLAPGERFVLGADGLGMLPGVPLGWPDGLDPARPRPETVLLLASAEPRDVNALAQPGVGRLPRDFQPTGPDEGGAFHDVSTVDFDLDPGFLVEERSGRSGSARTARDAVPRTVAVRLEELLVHRNHAWRGADIRIDTLVGTGLRETGTEPEYSARTERFARIHAGEALPVDRMLLYHGPSRDFLDLAIWVSRDAPGAPTLAELLTDAIGDFELREAIARLTPNLGAVPGAAGALGAVGLGALLVSLGYRLLRRESAEVIGLYRGSMLAHERFGAGRHPVEGSRRAQDFSLAFTIEDLGQCPETSGH